MSKQLIVFTAAVMDLFHEGHANLLKQMQLEAMLRTGPMDGATWRTVVLIHDDRSTWTNKKRFPAQSLDHRMRNVILTGLVNEVCPVCTPDPAFGAFLNTFPHGTEFLFMRGDDWPEFPGRHELELLKVPMKIIPYTKGVSSSEIRSQL